ncbi:putative NUDIX hydrolase [Rubripirellula lacrimiformis]|uniref:Putative NUDIX hydrolase n=1 Tax=Rubripirellula lacrimiformis TaxID=1930273 RepID=A0A517NHA0_9BACT|nr:CoA pyrophosphatase [Rubripirellula lacrimiformis]QDT06514.1 putative NUDIX hydrolase [Rubripirellula lacrimiformis]
MNFQRPEGRPDWAHEPRLGEKLSRGLIQAAESQDLQRRVDRLSSMSPVLAYGRHRGPAPRQSRIAAVVIAIYRDPDHGWTIPLTLRPTTLLHHGGQISLPGGQIDAGETIQQAAVREFEEELGIRPTVQSFCGELTTQYVYASENLVHTVVAIIDRPTQTWIPDPAEVAEVVTLPLSKLTDPACRCESVHSKSVIKDGRQVGSLAFRAGSIEHDGHQIWGATAMILDQLAQLLLKLG